MTWVTNHRYEVLKALGIEMAMESKNGLQDYICRPNSYIISDPLRQTSFLFFSLQITKELSELSNSLRRIDEDRFYKLHQKKLISEFTRIGIQFEWTYFLRDEMNRRILKEDSPLYDAPKSIFLVAQEQSIAKENLLSDLIKAFWHLIKKTLSQVEAASLEETIKEETAIFSHYLRKTFSAD